jgi:hypothetical protein
VFFSLLRCRQLRVPLPMKDETVCWALLR